MVFPQAIFHFHVSDSEGNQLRVLKGAMDSEPAHPKPKRSASDCWESKRFFSESGFAEFEGVPSDLDLYLQSSMRKNNPIPYIYIYIYP